MTRGISLSLTASLLFATLYYYTSLLAPLNGEQIFGWRMLFTLPVISLLVLAWGEWHKVNELARRLLREPMLWIILPLSSALIGIQLWLFMWAPLHGQALEVSTGYFMLPLTMILVGRHLYGDHLSMWQRLATLCAALGVAHEFYQTGGFSWSSLLVALGYPLYFVLRHHAKTNSIGGLWFDMLLILPLALWFATAGMDLNTLFETQPRLYFLIPLLGLISAMALAAYILASHRLPLSLFGLLGYVEPVLLVLVALILGERIGPAQWLTYGPIWLAVGLLGVEGIIALRAKANSRRGNTAALIEPPS